MRSSNFGGYTESGQDDARNMGGNNDNLTLFNNKNSNNYKPSQNSSNIINSYENRISGQNNDSSNNSSGSGNVGKGAMLASMI